MLVYVMKRAPSARTCVAVGSSETHVGLSVGLVHIVWRDHCSDVVAAAQLDRGEAATLYAQLGNALGIR